MFWSRIVSSIMLFGTGATFVHPIERLTYSISALEALLLRHSAEPIEFIVAERMGLLIGRGATARDDIARNAREAFRLRSRHDLARFAPHEMGSIATFLHHAQMAISVALGNTETFETVGEFVASIDGLKRKIKS
jgi:hypothetical protein